MHLNKTYQVIHQIWSHDGADSRNESCGTDTESCGAESSGNILDRLISPKTHQVVHQIWSHDGANS